MIEQAAQDKLMATADRIDATSRALSDVVRMLAAGYTQRTREWASLSCSDVAETLGCTEAEVEAWERGSVPRADLALRLHALTRRLEEEAELRGDLQRQGFVVRAVVSV
jgi:DNA-binding transcriptional regulator YiaG